MGRKAHGSARFQLYSGTAERVAESAFGATSGFFSVGLFGSTKLGAGWFFWIGPCNERRLSATDLLDANDRNVGGFCHGSSSAKSGCFGYSHSIRLTIRSSHGLGEELGDFPCLALTAEQYLLTVSGNPFIGRRLEVIRSCSAGVRRTSSVAQGRRTARRSSRR